LNLLLLVSYLRKNKYLSRESVYNINGPFLVVAEYLYTGISYILHLHAFDTVRYDMPVVCVVVFFRLIFFFFFLLLLFFFFFVTPILMFPSYNNIIYIILRVSHPIFERLVSRRTSIFELRSHARDVFPDETRRAHFFALHPRAPHKTGVIPSEGVSFAHST
jgi:hypothetical protein